MPLFRAHVIRGAEYLAGAGDLCVEFGFLRQPEIDQRDGTVLAQHDVAGFEIAV